MRRLLFASATAAFCMLTIESPSAQAALICKDGRLHYGGSGFYSNRQEAEASAIEAWRRVRAGSVGASRAAKMFPKANSCTVLGLRPEKAGAASCEGATVTRRNAGGEWRQTMI
jgi:hypothetical protein